MPTSRRMADHAHHSLFSFLYRRSLVFNTCWEDPAVDRRALEITPDDRILVITSAGCNTLDYALAGPAAIHAVDANPRQTALLDLKLAGIRRLDFPTFFSVFGEGRLPGFRKLYRETLRDELSGFSRHYWDRHGKCFEGRGWRNSFYWHGLTGLFARLFHTYTACRPRLRRALKALLETETLEEQRRVYRKSVEPILWNRAVEWALRRSLTMTLLGIPYTQRREIQAHFQGELPEFLRGVLRRIFETVPLRSNYFWTLYMRGHYTRDCCPEYLKEENFERLRDGLADRIHPRTCTVTEFLAETRESISKFVLLDHMDWMSTYHPDALAEEWGRILESADQGARVIFRSGSPRPTFLDELVVTEPSSGSTRLKALLDFEEERARRLDRRDRVGTYGSFHIARIRAA